MPRLRSIPGSRRRRDGCCSTHLRPTRIVGSDGEQRALSDGIGVEDGDALVVATSGTSGHPKGVVLTHDAIAASAQWRRRPGWASTLPVMSGWPACRWRTSEASAVVTRSIVTGTPVVVLPGFEAEVVEEAGRSGQVSHVSLVATALQRLDPSVFTCVLLGGSRVPDALPPNAVATYGMTETGSGVVYDGWPLDGVELSFRPPAGADGRAGR